MNICHWRFGMIAMAALSGAAITDASARVIWSGDFSTGNFMQYHAPSTANDVYFWFVPDYGRPTVPQNLLPGQRYAQSGNGELVSIVSSPTRGGRYAAKFTVKNSANGNEPADCGGSASSPDCTIRRTQLQMVRTHTDFYDTLPYQKSRWISLSVYLPADFDNGGSGWGPVILGSKPRNEKSGVSGHFQIQLDRDSWTITHRWSPVLDPAPADVPWQYKMEYTGSFPNADEWPAGLEDFATPESQAALKSVQRGVWTDWVVQLHNDARGSKEGGRGFMTVWKREGTGPWIKIVHIVPKVMTRGGLTFDRGVGYNLPARTDNNGGYGLNYGLYMDKARVWSNSKNMVVYLANAKIGDETATFSEMSPDGSTPEDGVPAAPTGMKVD